MDYQAKFRGAVSRFLDDTTETAYDGQISVGAFRALGGMVPRA